MKNVQTMVYRIYYVLALLCRSKAHSSGKIGSQLRCCSCFTVSAAALCTQNTCTKGFLTHGFQISSQKHQKMASLWARGALKEHFSVFSKILLILCDLNVVSGLFMVHKNCARLDWYHKTQFCPYLINSNRKCGPTLVGPCIEHKNE